MYNSCCFYIRKIAMQIFYVTEKKNSKNISEMQIFLNLLDATYVAAEA